MDSRWYCLVDQPTFYYKYLFYILLLNHERDNLAIQVHLHSIHSILLDQYTLLSHLAQM